jgi:hypothetical protein
VKETTKKDGQPDFLGAQLIRLKSKSTLATGTLDMWEKGAAEQGTLTKKSCKMYAIGGGCDVLAYYFE